MIREHIGVRTARRNFLQSKLRNLGPNAGARQRRGDHDALAEFEVVIVERDDVLERPQLVGDPAIVDAIEPRQIDHGC